MKTVGIVIIVAIIGISSVIGQNANQPPKPVSKAAQLSWGSVENGKFVSGRLGLTFSIPSEYSLISKAEGDVLRDAGADMLKQGSASEKRLDEAIERTVSLVAISEKALGSPENSVLEIVTARQDPRVTAKMSLAANLMVLKGSPYTLKRSLGEIKLGSNTFSAAELEGVFGEIRVLQRMYVVMHRGYSVIVAVVYFSDQQRLAMEKLIATLDLKK